MHLLWNFCNTHSIHLLLKKRDFFLKLPSEKTSVWMNAELHRWAQTCENGENGENCIHSDSGVYYTSSL